MGATVREDEVASEDELVEQSEVAADYMEGLLDILDLDGDIDELVVGDRPQVEIVGADLSSLVGPKGQTLEALQELCRLAVYRKTGDHSRLMLDIGGYRAGRRKKLADLAEKTAKKVLETGNVVKLDPMSAFERKCVHDVINATEGVQSESEGAEPRRRVVVKPEA